MQYSIINHSLCAVRHLSRTDLFYYRKFVPFDPLLPVGYFQK